LEEIMTNLPSFPWAFPLQGIFSLGQLYLKLFGLSCFGLEGYFLPSGWASSSFFLSLSLSLLFLLFF
jgi:hypothetical protein